VKIPPRKFLHLAAGAAAMPTFSNSLSAQAYPTSPIRFVVPLAAGGGLDFVARLVGEYLTHSIGQQVYIENKTGAGGTIGIDAAAKSAPDGYTVLIGSDNLASLPHVMKVNIDYAKVLAPVIALSRQPNVLATHPSFGANSIAELIAAAKRRPGLGFATSGVGTSQHFVGEWFARLAGIKLEHVPYRGAGQAVNDLVAGHVPIGVLGPTALIPPSAPSCRSERHSMLSRGSMPKWRRHWPIPLRAPASPKPPMSRSAAAQRRSPSCSTTMPPNMPN
jgi:tripartite-type tricarboxylate transporter receptor subunit TctC